jgi:acyl transferase domain-containing protein/NAD(P)-dependent dehydrogenase (short-subunit alcohol dehydrogenase family)/acyl carrier protein
MIGQGQVSGATNENGGTMTRPFESSIAVIGIASRFPDANDYQQFWSNLVAGRNSIIEIPITRSDISQYYSSEPEPGKSISKWAGLIEGIDQFDAGFFGISPREAKRMDPQQRVMLELTWSCLEDAGYAPNTLSGKDIGVFIGVCNYDYDQLQHRHERYIEGHTATGTYTCIIPNRISYFFNFHGPSVPVDTACSSSLVAIHQAISSIEKGECEMALVGGISLLCASTSYISFSQLGMLSGAGQCKTFDREADGYVRGEGAGIVLLKPLARALSDRDRIYGVIKGSAVNHGGKARTLTSPNVYAQSKVIRAAYVQAGISPETVTYIETHGTGTPLGDPIEVNGLKRAFSQLFQEQGHQTPPQLYCALGAVKTNIGHLESAAGIAGLIKVLLAMQHHQLPKLANFNQQNPRIKLEDSPFYLLTDTCDWPLLLDDSGEIIPRRAGVSSFGFGGVNAHLVLEEALNKAVGREHQARGIERSHYLLTLSAKTETALKALLIRYQAHLQTHPEQELADIAYTTNVGRSHFSYRLAIVAPSLENLQDKLVRLQSENRSENRIVGCHGNEIPPGLTSPKIAFMFSGQGSQSVNMGLDLYRTEPVFRESVDRCCEILKLHLGMDLRRILYPGILDPESYSESEPTSAATDATEQFATEQLAQTQFAQPALFAIEYALAQMWMSWGIQPQGAIGHSIGEYVAATLAGVMSLADALMVVAVRGRLMQQLPPGAMLGVGLSASEVAPLLEENLSIATINGRSRCAVSGTIEAIDRFATKLANKNIDCRRLHTSHAFHSPMMEPILQEFAWEMAQIPLHPPQIPYISNVTGTWITAEEATDPQYWANHLRQPVQFAAGLDVLARDPDCLLLEVGPGRVLTTLALDHLDRNPDYPVISSLGHPQQQQSDVAVVLTALGQLWLAGVPVDWAGFYAGERRHRLPLPTYPFERQRYWIETPPVRQQERRRSPDGHFYHPLLGQLLRSPLQQQIFQSELDADSLSFLQDSRIESRIVLPATAYWEMALAAAQAFCPETAPGNRARKSRLEPRLESRLENVTMRQPLIFSNAGGYLLQTIVNPEANPEINPEASDRLTFEIYSLPGDAPPNASWTLHATGAVSAGSAGSVESPSPHSSPSLPTLAQLRSGSLETLDVSTFAQMLSRWGLDEGNSFGTVKQLWRGDGEVLGKLEFPATEATEIGDYQIHPAGLEAALRLFVAMLPESGDAGGDAGGKDIYQPLSLERLQVFAPLSSTFWSDLQLRSLESNSDAIAIDVCLFDDRENLVATIEGLHLKRVDRSALLSATEDLQNWLYEVKWQRQDIVGRGEKLFAPTGSPPLTAPTQIASKLLPQATDVLGQTKRNFALFENLEALSIEYVWQALQQLGWDYRPGERFSTPEIADRFRIVKRHRLLFERMLEMLQEEGILKRTEGDSQSVPLWEFCQSRENQDLSIDSASRLQKFPQGIAELTLLENCGSHLAPALRGERDPLELLFPQGSSSQVERFYAESPTSKAYNTLVSEAIATALEQWPSTQKLRVLEIGAGTGSTTTEILSVLPPGCTEYVFTDVSPLFLAKASEKFGDRDILRYQLLDMEKDPLSQGFSSHEFHIIIAANVLHATADLGATLHRVRQLLAPEGLLVLLEVTQPQRWLDLTFGLTEGWWKFAESDEGRSHPLLSASQWLSLLPETGFSEAVTVPDTGERDGLFGEQRVIVAQNAPLATPTINRGNPWGISDAQNERWLIFADRSGVGERLAAELTGQGAKCDLVFWGERYEATNEATNGNSFTIDPRRSPDYQQLWLQLREKSSGANYTGAVHLWSLDCADSDSLTVEELETAVELSCSSIMHWVQLLAAEASGSLPLWAVTKGARPVGEKPAIVAVAQAPLWGFCQAIALEHPALWGGAIDLDPASSVAEAAQTLCAELSQGDAVGQMVTSPLREDRIAFRQGCRYVARLRRFPRSGKSAPALTWRSDSSYLITGGWGGIGLTVARFCAEQGAKHLILMGRTQFPSRELWDRLAPDHPLFAKITAIRELESMGSEIHLATVDVGDESQLSNFLESWQQQNLPPIRGVIHAAVELEAETLQKLETEALNRIFRAKAIGSWLLNEYLTTEPLDFFVLFSSISSVLVDYGLASYAAANAFLDALAHYRTSKAQRGLSINWGVWEKVGLVAGDRYKQADDYLSRLGMSEIQPYQGIKLLEQLIRQDTVQAAVMPANWSQCRSFYLEHLEQRQPPLLEDLIQSAEEAPATVPSTQTRLNREALLKASEPERQPLLEDYLAERLAKILGIKPSQLDRQQPTNTLGLDSLMAIELKNQVETDFGATIPMADFYRGFSLAELATSILDKLAGTNLEETDSKDSDSKDSDIEAAERLLSGLDELSDEEVDGLLDVLLQEQLQEQLEE